MEQNGTTESSRAATLLREEELASGAITTTDLYSQYPLGDPRNTHITIGVIVAVVVVVAIMVVVWCFKPCASRDRRMKTASNATSIASI